MSHQAGIWNTHTHTHMLVNSYYLEYTLLNGICFHLLLLCRSMNIYIINVSSSIDQFLSFPMCQLFTLVDNTCKSIQAIRLYTLKNNLFHTLYYTYIIHYISYFIKYNIYCITIFKSVLAIICQVIWKHLHVIHKIPMNNKSAELLKQKYIKCEMMYIEETGRDVECCMR